MIKKILTMVTLAAALGSSAQHVEAEVSTHTTNRNIFYGMNFGKERTQYMQRSQLKVKKRNIFATTWTNYHLSNGNILETDFAIGYENSFTDKNNNTFSGRATLTYLAFPGIDLDDLQSLTLNAGLEKNRFNGELVYHQLFNYATPGKLLEVKLSKTIPVKKIDFTVGVETMYNSEYFNSTKGLSHIGSFIDASIDLGKNTVLNTRYQIQRRASSNFENLVFNEGYFNVELVHKM